LLFLIALTIGLYNTFYSDTNCDVVTTTIYVGMAVFQVNSQLFAPSCSEQNASGFSFLLFLSQ